MMNKNKVIVIAEAGVNHNGDINLAKKLIDIAANSGADYVKFQSFKAAKLASKDSKKANYQMLNSNSNDNSQYQMLKKLELSQKDHLILIDYCNQKKIQFLSSPFDSDSIDYLDSLNMDLFKIPSGEITNYQLLKKISTFSKPVILSTGMSTIDEIKSAINILTSAKLNLNDITVLHCNTEYPTPYVDANISAMLDLHKNLDVNFGLSDHTLGIEVSIAAVALGAKVIEKHFTIDKTLEGPDHKASLEEFELIEMVRSIRNVELSLGDGIKKVTDSEKKNLSIARKSIYLNCNVFKGQKIKDKMLLALRPGDGISPMEIPNILNKKFTKDLKIHTKLTMNDFE